MKAFTLPLLIAAMASCLLQAQDPFEPGPDEKAAEETDSAAAFYGDDNPVDLNSIRGKPIKHLRFMACDKLTDVSALAGMKLEEVMFWKTNIKDLTPLAGMPIKNLVIFGGRVKDLTPLKGMPLESLRLGATEVTDLSPLKGLPLKDLNLFASEITDLSPLAGMPLESLDLSVVDSGKITDLTPLTGMKLKWLVFDANTITKGMEIIRGMKSLEDINRLKPDKFWQKYDADAPARNRLRELGINYRNLDVADDGSWSLSFHGDDIRDLAVLKGLPIGTLGLQKSTIADLSPLAGSKMTCLNLGSTTVKDLSALGKMSLNALYLSCPEVDDILPLKGLPLETLQLSCPKLGDLSALHGMPLKTLYLSGTKVRDVSPLEGLHLESLFVDIHRIEVGIKVLRRMKSLERINNCDVEQVWSKYERPIILTQAEACADADLVVVGTIGAPEKVPDSSQDEKPRPMWTWRFTHSATMKDSKILLGEAPGGVLIYGGKAPEGLDHRLEAGDFLLLLTRVGVGSYCAVDSDNSFMPAKDGKIEWVVNPVTKEKLWITTEEALDRIKALRTEADNSRQNDKAVKEPKPAR